MLKRFIKDSAIYGISGVLSRGIGLLLLPLYTRVLTPREYGMVDMLQVARSLIALTVALEIVQGLVRLLVDATSASERRVLASTALWFTAGAYGIFAVAGLIWAAPLSRWLFDTPDAVGTFHVALGYIVSAGVFSLLQDQLRFNFQAKAYALASTANLVVVALVTVGLLLGTELRVSAVFLGLTAGNVAGVLLSLHASRGRYAPVFSPEKCREMLAFSVPLVASGAAVFVLMFVDRIAIRQLLGIRDVGLYGVGARFASATSLLVSVLQMALTPLIYNHHSDPGTPREIARIFRVVLVFLLPVIVLLGIFAPEIIARITTREYLPAAGVVPVLAASVILSQLWVFFPGLGLEKRTRTIAVLNAVAAGLNAGLNYLLIPYWGIMGAAAATLAGSTFAAAAYVLLGSRYYPVPHEWPRLLTAVALSTAAVVAAALTWGSVPAADNGVWLGKIALCLVAAVSIGVVLIHWGEIRNVRSILSGALGAT